MGLFLFTDGGPALVCGWVNFPILWPHTPVQMKLTPPRSPTLGFFVLTPVTHACHISVHRYQLGDGLKQNSEECRKLPGHGVCLQGKGIGLVLGCPIASLL